MMTTVVISLYYAVIHECSTGLRVWYYISSLTVIRCSTPAVCIGG